MLNNDSSHRVFSQIFRSPFRSVGICFLLIAFFLLPSVCSAQDTVFEKLPSTQEFLNVIFMRDYNTRIVLMGTTLFGLSAGVVGVFTLLRKRSLVGDVVSHSALPGIGIAFLVMEAIHPGGGKNLLGLLVGASVAGILGVTCTTLLKRVNRIKEDASLAIVRSVFFGLGIVLFTIIQGIPTGSASGLNHFIFGKAASMTSADVQFISIASAITIFICILLYKEMNLLCFDEEFASIRGWPVLFLDFLLMFMVVGVTIVGLQSVGLLLVVAMLITPAASARFWTNRLNRMLPISAFIGGFSAFTGVVLSALFPKLATGAIIVLVASFCFMMSLLLGRRGGVIVKMRSYFKLQKRIGRDDLLRAFYEVIEMDTGEASKDLFEKNLETNKVKIEQLLNRRSWSMKRVKRLLKSAVRNDLVINISENSYRLTADGIRHAQETVRNHRLWEIYLIRYAEFGSAHVDQLADQIEHVVDAEVLQELEKSLREDPTHLDIPQSPHPITHDY